MRQELKDLIKRMSTYEEGLINSKDSVSWHAYREAEKLTDLNLVIELQSFLAGKTTKDERRAAYFIIGKIGKNQGNGDCADFLIKRLTPELHKYELGNILQAIAEIPKRPEVNLSSIFQLLADPRWLVRYAAIAALENTASQEAEAKILELLQSTEDAYDMIGCHATLSNIGSPKAIPTLERALKSRKRDVKDSAVFAIEKILQRSSTSALGR